MKNYPTQPLDLMQFINTKYHDPFIHELLEFDGGVDKDDLRRKRIQAAHLSAVRFLYWQGGGKPRLSDDAGIFAAYERAYRNRLDDFENASFDDRQLQKRKGV